MSVSVSVLELDPLEKKEKQKGWPASTPQHRASHAHHLQTCDPAPPELPVPKMPLSCFMGSVYSHWPGWCWICGFPVCL